MKQPNLFIVGAPKCGTTALGEYLSTHPNVYISRPTEPLFFAEEFQRPQIKTWEQYLSLFEKATDQQTVIGEASAYYLYSAQAIQKIYTYDPNAKIIALLRNPVDLVHSYHSQLLYNLGSENEADFEKAWHLQSSRAKGFNLSKSCKNPEALKYKAIGQLGTQVERLLSIFPAQQVKLIIFDDFITSTKKIYEEVLSFLEIPSDHREEFPRINANRKHKIVWVGKLTQNPPQVLIKGLNLIKKSLGVKRFNISKSIREMNKEHFERSPLDASFRAYLTTEFKEEVDKLAQILNRDLTAWRN